MSPPTNSVSEDRVKLMIIEGLKEYERSVVEPRHRETQGELANIKGLIQQGKGAMRLGGYTLSAASLLWIVLQVIHHVTH